MIFTVSLYLSLTIFALGLLYKFWSWVSLKIGPEAEDAPVGLRASAAMGAFITSLFSVNLVAIVKALVLDVLLQINILKKDFLSWLMHMLIFHGFMLLLLMHAMDELVSEKIFDGYYSTLNPYFFLRNVFGAMVIIGVGIAIFRRLKLKPLNQVSGKRDVIAIVILAVIMGSGFLLDSAKIVSQNVFDQMVVDYAGFEDKEESIPLMHYWAKDFGVVFEDFDEFDPEMIEEGKEMHVDFACADCHSKPDSLFISWPLAKVMKPVANSLNKADAPNILYYIHIFACFLGLAYLPCSKFFHIIATPITLIIKRCAAPRPNPVLKANRRALEIDGCTHCGNCSVHCSVRPIFEVLGNSNILPSEKLAATGDYAKNKEKADYDAGMFSEGSFICTECNRCTDVCTAGLNLQDIWLAVKKDLVRNNDQAPFEKLKEKAAGAVTPKDAVLKPGKPGLEKHLMLSSQADTFSRCFECQTCTNVCPAVGLYDNPGEKLGLMPHQIMHSLALGLKDDATGAAMVWDCLTCYMCQEMCPQGVKVTDVLYELKNMANQKIEEPV